MRRWPNLITNKLHSYNCTHTSPYCFITILKIAAFDNMHFYMFFYFGSPIVIYAFEKLLIWIFENIFDWWITKQYTQSASDTRKQLFATFFIFTGVGPSVSATTVHILEYRPYMRMHDTQVMQIMHILYSTILYTYT